MSDIKSMLEELLHETGEIRGYIDEALILLSRRIDKLEKDSHPPIPLTKQVEIVVKPLEKRLEELESVSAPTRCHTNNLLCIIGDNGCCVNCGRRV